MHTGVGTDNIDEIPASDARLEFLSLAVYISLGRMACTESAALQASSHAVHYPAYDALGVRSLLPGRLSSTSLASTP
jgi:hypothetical protein